MERRIAGRPRGRRGVPFATLLLLLLLPARALGQGGPGANGIELLSLPMGARGIVLGGAAAGLVGSVESILYNPAGLAPIEEVHLGLAYHSALDFRQGFIAAAFPLSGLGRVGLSVKYFSFDDQEATGPSGPEEVLGTFSPHATAFRLTLARGLGERLLLGVSLALYEVELAPAPLLAPVLGGTGFKGGGTGFAGDVGLLIRPIAGAPFSLGAALLDLGTGIAFFEGGEREPLPRRLRVGASLEALGWLAPGVAENLSLRVSFDSEQPLVGGADADQNIQHVGLELGLSNLAYLRTGLRHDPLDSETTAALGLGLRLKGFSFDLARLVGGNEFVSGDMYLSGEFRF